MAGGKETQRQKMIGLMYLVLLALLALQVSSAIIDKFNFLNQSLEQANTGAVNRNIAAVSGIQKSVTESGSKSKDVAVLDQAKLVRQESKDLIEYLENVKQKLIAESGGKDAEGNFPGAKEETKIETIMVGDNISKKGEGREMQDRLNAYAAKMSQISKSKDWGKLALDGSEHPLFQKDPQQKRKSFSELNFAQTPMIAALAVISEKQARVATIEAEVLSELALAVGATEFKFDKLRAVARAESKVVAAGTKYNADMFISATSSAMNPTMKFKGTPVQVDANGVGKISFVASANNYDADGNSKQVWEGQITMKNPGGGDTTYTVREEYIVAKPVLSVQSASVSALYMNCGNDLDVQVPALGATYDPAFNASNANIIKGSKKGQVIIVPSSTKDVTLSVSSGGNAIGSQTFKVRRVPQPSLGVFVGNRPADIRNGEATAPRSLLIRAIPDPSFEAALPNEARYAVTEAEIILAKGGRRPAGTKTTNSPMVDLSQLAAQAESGDAFVIEVKKVVRKNFKDQTEEVEIPAASRVLILRIK
jgi:gliding motility-associated protein GldM